MATVNQLPATDSMSQPLFYRETHRQSVDTTELMQSLAPPDRTPLSRFFTATRLKPGHQVPLTVHQYQPDWILGIVLLCLILLAWSNFFYHKRLRQIFLSPYSKRFLNQLVRDGNLFSERITVVLVLVYLMTVSLVVYLSASLLAIPLPDAITPYILFGIIFAGLIVYWLLKSLVIRVVGVTFRTESTTREYLLNVLIFNIITGVSLLPFLIPALYLKSTLFLYSCFAILFVFLLFRFFRGFLIGISLRKFSYLFLIVYLCALEILPLFMLLKMILLYFGTKNPVQ